MDPRQPTEPLPHYRAMLSPEGAPQVACAGDVETYVAQKTPELNALDAIVRAACRAVADGHAAALLGYDPALAAAAAIIRQPVDQLPADPAAAGLRKTYDLAARRVALELAADG